MATETARAEVEKVVVVFFNKKRFEAPKDTMTGKELRALFGVPAQNKLYKEEPGKPHEDTLITDEMAVHLKNGDRFYDVPPGIGG